MKLRFFTATPLNVYQGSGTFMGTWTLAKALEDLGATVEIVSPVRRLPTFTARRLWFNEEIRRKGDSCDLTVGVDMDGYRLAGRGRVPHVAAIKGVIADELRFERGTVRWSLTLQSLCEAAHVRRADLVITTSQYAASAIRRLYKLADEPACVPEPIDLTRWETLLSRNAAEPDPRCFTLLCVCRFYPRKRVSLLLRAAALLRHRIPELRVRIVGGGPEEANLKRLHAELNLGERVAWLGSIPTDDLAREYSRCDAFCLPSLQEGFGIAFLEAMAAGKPVIAAKAAAIPEVIPHGFLAEPDSAESLADAIAECRANAGVRDRFVRGAREWVRQFDAPRVALRFLREIETLL
ncbi:MAG: glycosyltransferase family 4 protein [Bryobacteraceae bacterium]